MKTLVNNFKSQRSLFSPIIDFLLIGGGSIIFLIICGVFIPENTVLIKKLTVWAWGLQFAINFPHFAFSYQIIYQGLAKKLTNLETPKVFRFRLFLSSIIVPILLVVLLTYAFVSADKNMLGYMANAMFFFVGWHYVKQGFGMLMVISAKNKFYFSNKERKFLLLHTYMAWLTSWSLFNISNSDGQLLHGIFFQAVKLPNFIFVLLLYSFLISLIALVYHMVVAVIKHKTLPPVNAIIGYISAVYIWTVMVPVFSPEYFLFIPAFHSLQYMIFVCKYKKVDYQKNNNIASNSWLKNSNIFNQFNIFVLSGVILGALGFFYIPYSLDSIIYLDYNIFGPTFFFFCAIIFINIHHYFIDNVIWRRENGNVQYLME
jgi:hypothetical protein